MLDLLKAELLRFRAWAIGLALAHLAWLVFLDRVADPLQQPLQIYQVYGGLLALLGLLFGFVQLSAYARQTAWIDLLHRPVAPRRIGCAMLMSGLALGVVTVALPTASLLAFHKMTVGQGVESRHFLLPLAAWAIAGTGYCIGAHLRLGTPRLGWAAALFLVWIYQTEAYGPAAVLIQLAALAVTFLIALGDFRPDRGRYPMPWQAFAEVTLAGFAIGISGIFALRFLIQLAMMMLGTHPLNGVPPSGGLVEAVRADGRDLIVRGLDQRVARPRFWAEQAMLSEVVTVMPELRDLSPRYSLANPGASVIEDKAAHLQWNFNHDTMRYVALDRRTRSFSREQTPTPRLSAPPIAMRDGAMIIAGSKVLRYDGASRRFVDRIDLPSDERLLSPPQPVWDRLALLSDRVLRIYDGRVMRLGDVKLPAQIRIALPNSPADLSRIDILELLDGYLISFTFGSRVPEGFGKAEQQLWYVEPGRAQPVATRRLGPDYPALMRYVDLWFAPVIATVGRSADRWLAAPNRMNDLSTREPPGWIFALALALHMLAAALAWHRSQLLGQRVAERMQWALACLVLGPSLLMAFLLSFRPRLGC